MPHVTFVTLAGFRIHSEELRELGLTLPGFEERAGALAELPALGLITLAGMLPEHWTSDYWTLANVDENLVERIMEGRPDLVAISALTASIEEAYLLSVMLRGGGIRTIIGGLHATACPDEVLENADAVAIGQGELIWPQVMSDVDAGRLQRRYFASWGAGLSEFPVPRFDLLGNVSRYTVQTQRGCPFACDFCAASRLLGRFSEKPVEQISQELEAILRLDPKPLIELADDNTFAGSRDFGPFFDLFDGANVRWFTESDWRMGERPEILSRLAASGCVQVLVGLESTIFRYPGMGLKAAEFERMEQAVIAIQESGVAVNACFIVGADGETRDSMDRLTAYLLQAPFADVQVTLQTPFPGAGLRSRLESAGRLLGERGWSHYSLFDVTFQPDAMTVGELETSFRELIKHVYGPTATQRRRRIRREIWRNNPRLRNGAPAHSDSSHAQDDRPIFDRTTAGD
ncbi:MAG: cobalamin-dependent protein [Planctomycetaceae bacterium]|nr:cobalamin-dependent protein [Planctomycetaceae bacterium]